MWSLREVYSSKKGFSLIGMVLYFGILSIILITMYSLLFYTSNSYKMIDTIDMSLFEGRYVVEYIKDEILSSDRIISSSNFDTLDFDYPNNIGFVSMEEETVYNSDGSISRVNYNFRTYYLNENKLMRMAYNTDNDSIYKFDSKAGHNPISDEVLDISNTNLDLDNSQINLSIIVDQGSNPLIMETSINIRCPIQ
ncbi:MAG: hypothetical protein RIN55_04115 [Tissierellaceae bacterium]|nr:hypothetical protein [Tissierellaceae bacterium]